MANIDTYAVFAARGPFEKGSLLGHAKHYADGRFRFFPVEGKAKAGRYATLEKCLLKCLPRHWNGLDGTVSELVK